MRRLHFIMITGILIAMLAAGVLADCRNGPPKDCITVKGDTIEVVLPQGQPHRHMRIFQEAGKIAQGNRAVMTLRVRSDDPRAEPEEFHVMHPPSSTGWQVFLISPEGNAVGHMNDYTYDPAVGRALQRISDEFERNAGTTPFSATLTFGSDTTFPASAMASYKSIFATSAQAGDVVIIKDRDGSTLRVLSFIGGEGDAARWRDRKGREFSISALKKYLSGIVGEIHEAPQGGIIIGPRKELTGLGKIDAEIFDIGESIQALQKQIYESNIALKEPFSFEGVPEKERAMRMQEYEDMKRLLSDRRVRLGELKARYARELLNRDETELAQLRNALSKKGPTLSAAEKKTAQDAIDQLTEQLNAREDAIYKADRELAQARWNAATGRQKFLAGLSDFLSGYQQYAGLGTLGSLFIGDEALKRQRKTVEDAFCKTVILGGTKCWASTLCGKPTRHRPGSGLAVTETPRGSPRVVAHIEGARSPPVLNPETGKTEYLYKITYALSLPEAKHGSYNVIFHKRGGGTFSWFEPDAGFERAVSAQGTAPLIAYSPEDYTTICLRFTPPVEAFGDSGRMVGTICNTIIQQGGKPTRVRAPQNHGAPTAPGGREPGFGF